jgi:hypothetical protein
MTGYKAAPNKGNHPYQVKLRQEAGWTPSMGD